MTWQRSVFETMGTVVSFVFDAQDEGASDAVQAVLAGYDDRFSLYKPTSELSRIGRSELRLADASEEMLRMYSAALEWRVRTGGNFTPHRPDGIVDLSGIVKAQAMSDAGDLLLQRGVSDWCLNVGGDVLVAGVDEAGEPWKVGIVDPDDRIELLTALPLLGSRRACATSGAAERGDHIWMFGEPATPFTQVTVVADDIVTADVLATAIIAGGQAELDRVCARYDVDVLSIDTAGELRATPGVAQLVVAR